MIAILLVFVALYAAYITFALSVSRLLKGRRDDDNTGIKVPSRGPRPD